MRNLDKMASSLLNLLIVSNPIRLYRTEASYKPQNTLCHIHDHSSYGLQQNASMQKFMHRNE